MFYYDTVLIIRYKLIPEIFKMPSPRCKFLKETRLVFIFLVWLDGFFQVNEMKISIRALYLKAKNRNSNRYDLLISDKYSLIHVAISNTSV